MSARNLTTTEPILKRIKKAYQEQHPATKDIRVGQLISNALAYGGYPADYLFYVENEDLLEALELYLCSTEGQANK